MEKPSSASSAQGAAQQVTREDLYELVWREPMLRVAERHAVSSSFLARVGYGVGDEMGYRMALDAQTPQATQLRLEP